MAPLKGIRVIEFCQIAAGPFAGMLLADMGADVIKVQSPEGDGMRNWPPHTGGYSENFASLNRNKRSVVFDLKDQAQLNTARRLCLTADVVLENFRPGVMREFRLDYGSLAPKHPALIYASISGYGQTGPARAKGGFDLIAQGVSGLMSVTGEPGRPPVKVGVPITDLGAAMFALAAILAALHYRTRTGHGQYIDTSLVEAGLAFSVWESAQYFGEGVTPEPLGSAHRMLAPYQAIRCADGYITLGAANDRLFERFCASLGHPEWPEEPQFADATQRVKNRAALIARIEAITTLEPRQHWIDRFEANGIPCGPINNYAEAFADPQTRAREMVVEIDHPALGKLHVPGSPIKMSETPPAVGRRAPLLGEHTREVLAEAGCSDDEIAAALKTS
jgi:formyl-CoA transferase